MAHPDIEDAPLPSKPYRLTIVDEQGKQHDIEVDPGKLPYGDHGLPGSILDIALEHGIDIDHACGGVCACSTCHVVVDQGADSCNEASEREEDQLDNAYGLTGSSRLACQCVPNGSKNVRIAVPAWNRNLVRE